jgi:hypothetical protein
MMIDWPELDDLDQLAEGEQIIDSPLLQLAEFSCFDFAFSELPLNGLVQNAQEGNKYWIGQNKPNSEYTNFTEEPDNQLTKVEIDAKKRLSTLVNNNKVSSPKLATDDKHIRKNVVHLAPLNNSVSSAGISYTRQKIQDSIFMSETEWCDKYLALSSQFKQSKMDAVKVFGTWVVNHDLIHLPLCLQSRCIEIGNSINQEDQHEFQQILMSAKLGRYNEVVSNQVNEYNKIWDNKFESTGQVKNHQHTLLLSDKLTSTESKINEVMNAVEILNAVFSLKTEIELLQSELQIIKGLVMELVSNK